MRRYQIYLEQDSVSVLDEIQKLTKIPRSQLIRGIIDRYVQNLTKVMIEKSNLEEKKYLLDDLIGSIKLDSETETNFAQMPDLRFLQD
jgi:hypothetical protein